MRLHIDELEVKALAAGLDAYLPELAMEAARSEHARDAHELWERHRALQALRARLDTEEPAAMAKPPA